MGWDAFGLPAENAAMEKKVHPKKWTYENIATMKKQLKSMGLSLDWSRELATCDPTYYRHQQKMFLDFWKAGLAYRKEAWVNWDPVDNTVLANEQVIEGKGWRTGAPVERRKLTQWNLKITHFADELLSRLDTLDRWPEKVRLMQANWIGKSRGARVFWQLTDASGAAVPEKDGGKLEIFTTRPDTLFGASFMALSAEHPLVQGLAASDPGLQHFVAECRKTGTAAAEVETAEKQGYKLPLLAQHPLMPGKTVPVFAANFVLMEYGTGAIFGCPGHDERDHEFATKYGLPILQVVAPADGKKLNIADAPYVEDGVIVNSEFLDGLGVEDAKAKVIARLEEMGVGKGTTQYRLRDWLVSRQRYWGCPIPAIHCESCGVVPVPDKDLPVQLPDDVTFDRPGNPLDRHPTWKHVAVPDLRQARAPRDRHVRHLHRFELVLRPVHLAAARDGAVRSRGEPLLDAGRSVYRRRRARDPAPALFALLDARDARGPDDQPRRAVRRSVHPGHGLPRNLSRQRWHLADAGGDRARRWRQGRAHLRQEPGRGRPLGEDVQVEEERRRPGPDHPRLRRRHRALVHAVRQPARARSRMDRGRRHRRLALPAAPVPHRLAGDRGAAGDRHAEARDLLGRRHRAAPRRAQVDRRPLGRHRGLPLQQGRGAALRVRQHDRLGRGQGRRRRAGRCARRWKSSCA